MNGLLRYGRFNVVGAFGMLVQLGVLWLIHRLTPAHALWASVFSVEVAVVHNFFWHMRYTWRNLGVEKDLARRFWRFQLSNGAVSLVGNLLAMFVLLQVVGLPLMMANALAIGCCSLANFCLAEIWVFRGAEEPVADVRPATRISDARSRDAHQTF